MKDNTRSALINKSHTHIHTIFKKYLVELNLYITQLQLISITSQEHNQTIYQGL